MIRGVCGPVRSGKSYVSVWRAHEVMKAGRNVAASFSIGGFNGEPGAWYLLGGLADAFADEYRGFYFILDEAGGKLSARKGESLDDAAMQACQQVGHNLIDLDMLFQHPRQLEIVYRELIEEFHFVHRIGPSGEVEQRTGKRGLFTHPWAMFVTIYKPDVFDDQWNIKPGRGNSGFYIIPWLRYVAETYNSWDRVVSEADAELIRVVQETAASRFAVPRARVVRGKVVEQELPAGFGLLMPPRRLVRGSRAGQLTEPQPAHPAFLASLGLKVPGRPATVEEQAEQMGVGGKDLDVYQLRPIVKAAWPISDGAYRVVAEEGGEPLQLIVPGGECPVAGMTAVVSMVVQRATGRVLTTVFESWEAA